jgi:transcriptional regulator with XRE-family HTH domain
MGTPIEVSHRLRQIRMQQNLTLKQVEIRSHGKWKAVVVGSYERGSRSLSISKAQELCQFYGVPLALLFSPQNPHPNDEIKIEWRFDFRRLRELLLLPDLFSKQIYEFASYIVAKRDDWNGEVLTIRKSDIEVINILTKKNQNELLEALKNRNLLLQG